MRRQLLMVLLWLAGTIGATTVVFVTVESVNADLFRLGDPDLLSQRVTSKPQATSTFVPQLSPPPTTVTPTEAPTTTSTSEEPTTTITVEEPVTAESVEVAVTGTQPTARPVSDTTARGTTPPTAAPPATPATTQPPPPPPATTVPPPTTEETSPPTTVSSATCGQVASRAVGRNLLSYRWCPDGVRYSNAVALPGWTTTVLSKGPPIVSVAFSNGSTTLTCAVSADGDGVVTGSGDC